MSRNLKIFLVSALIILFAYLAWSVIAPSVFKTLFEYQKKEEKVGLGARINPKFMIVDRLGEEHELGSQFRHGLVLMIYSPTCSPCREAAVDAEERFKNNKNSNERAFAILQFSDKLDSKLTSLKDVQIFHSKIDRDESPFAGSSTPTFYQIDQEGILRQKRIGWYEGILDHLLPINDLSKP